MVLVILALGECTNIKQTKQNLKNNYIIMIVVNVMEGRSITRRDSFHPGAVREGISVRIRFCHFVKPFKCTANTRLFFLKAAALWQCLRFAQAEHWPFRRNG